MKFNKILSIFAFTLVLVLALTNISATYAVNYNLSSAIIENNGARNVTGSTPLTNVYVEGYACTDITCAIIGAQIPGLVNFTSSNVMTVTYPNTLPVSGRYVLYFHKDGFIGWEQIANYNSPDGGNYTTNSNQIIYLAQKRNGWAPVMNLSVRDSIPQLTPIRIGLNISIDANTYSAITQNMVSNIPLNETVRTLVTAQIVNSSGSIVNSSLQILQVPYSGYVPVNFSFAGLNQTGVYQVNVFANVSDNKIINSINQPPTTALFNVIQQGLTNYTSTVIEHLSYSPALPRLGDNVTITFDYTSVYVDESGVSFPANTTIRVNTTLGGVLVYSDISNRNSSGSFSATIPFNQTGNYLIMVTGTPNDTRGNQSFSWTQTLPFTINTALNITEIDDNNNNGGSSGSTVTGENKNKISFDTGIPGNESVINLSKPENKTGFSLTKLMFWLIFLILLLIIIIAVVYVMKR